VKKPAEPSTLSNMVKAHGLGVRLEVQAPVRILLMATHNPGLLKGVKNDSNQIEKCLVP